MRILLIKTSSMGDVVHNLPVVADLCRAFPGANIDWVVEEAFAPIPRLHPKVGRVIPVALRRWRRKPFESSTRKAFAELRQLLCNVQYDAVLDTQGLLKSALLARMANGVRHGLNWRSSREPLRLFYDRVHEIPWTLHAVERNRLLAAKALGFDLAAPPVFGLATSPPNNTTPQLALEQKNIAGPYAVFLHATSAARKEWPESHWVTLGKQLKSRGVSCVLPFGTSVEQARSQRLAAQIPGSCVPRALGLDALSSMLSLAKFVVGVDTGLSHLSAALMMPTVGIYCATDPAATGLYGSALALNIGGIGSTPGVAEALAAIEQVTGALKPRNGD
ncbi:MAG: lipopolysaccharide heptosyltransferase I [Burkholderiales bacterium]